MAGLRTTRLMQAHTEGQQRRQGYPVGTISQTVEKPSEIALPGSGPEVLVQYRQYVHNGECAKCGTRVSWNGGVDDVNVCPSDVCMRHAIEADAIVILKRIEAALPGWNGQIEEVIGDPEDHPIMHSLRRIERAMGITARLALEADRAEALRLAQDEVGEPETGMSDADFGAYVELITEATARHLKALRAAA